MPHSEHDDAAVQQDRQIHQHRISQRVLAEQAAVRHIHARPSSHAGRKPTRRGWYTTQ